MNLEKKKTDFIKNFAQNQICERTTETIVLHQVS